MPILRILAVATLTILSLGIGVAESVASPKKTLEVKTGVGAGVPVGELFDDDNPYAKTTQGAILVANARFRIPKTLSLGLEVSAVVPSGFGINVLFDVVKTEKFRLHIIDPGIFWNVFQPVSVSRVDRDWDITLGFGAEYSPFGRVSLTVDWRVYLPPPEIIVVFGDLARPMYGEAKGGQLCAGLSYLW